MENHTTSFENGFVITLDWCQRACTSYIFSFEMKRCIFRCSIKGDKEPRSPQIPIFVKYAVGDSETRFETFQLSIFRNYILSSMIIIFGLILNESDFHRFLPSSNDPSGGIIATIGYT